MKEVTYITLDQVDTSTLITLLNEQRIREHLIDHASFDNDSVKKWMKEKIQVDKTQGCKVRAVVVDGKLAGWCGIQFENKQHEIAIVIGEKHWGLGKKIFLDMTEWAKALGHKTLVIHFLNTRPEYRFLRKRAKKVYKSEWEGNQFTSYELEVK